MAYCKQNGRNNVLQHQNPCLTCWPQIGLLVSDKWVIKSFLIKPVSFLGHSYEVIFHPQLSQCGCEIWLLGTLSILLLYSYACDQFTL